MVKGRVVEDRRAATANCVTDTHLLDTVIRGTLERDSADGEVVEVNKEK